jgi:hypothetical protein
VIRVAGACGCFAVLALGCSGAPVGHAPAPSYTERNEPDVFSEPSQPRPATAAQGPYFVADPEGRAVAIQRGDAPNMRYAQLDRASCEAELSRRRVPFEQAEATAGVLAPVRLSGPMHGVSIHSTLPLAMRARAPSEVMDCRLVLALDDFSALVSQRGVAEIVHLSAYRSRAHGGCTPKYVGKQHCAALALDVAQFKRRDGSVLEVERDFHGRIGLSTCADNARPSPPSAASGELWDFVCDSARDAIFNVILTPNYNAQHKNHFHLEITPDAAWMLIK